MERPERAESRDDATATLQRPRRPGFAGRRGPQINSPQASAGAQRPKRAEDDQSGMLPCLRRGNSSRLVRRRRRPATIFCRVSAGSITSSTMPRSAAA